MTQTIRSIQTGKQYHKNYLTYFFLIIIYFQLSLSVSAQDKFVKTICLMSENGCSCQNKNDSFRYFHAESARVIKEEKQILHTIIRNTECLLKQGQYVPMPYTPVMNARLKNKLDHTPPALDKIADTKKIKNLKDIGYFWITYYHLAPEEFYPGPITDVISPSGKILDKASVEFLKQVTWEGSGVRLDGRRIRYAGIKNRFEYYSDTVWGYGAASGYTIWPYRTVAVNFPGLCDKLKIHNCSKESIGGILIYSKQIADLSIRVENMKAHDGYFCASDTGSPLFIRHDRMDIFVGLHGGGNPFLPVERSNNPLITGGVENILPSDWRIWKSVSERIFCDKNKIPADPMHPGIHDCKHDYHVIAAHKAIRFHAVLDEAGRPVRCYKKPLSN